MKTIQTIAANAGFVALVLVSVPVHFVNKKIEEAIMKPFN